METGSNDFVLFPRLKVLYSLHANIYSFPHFRRLPFKLYECRQTIHLERYHRAYWRSRLSDQALIMAVEKATKIYRQASRSDQNNLTKEERENLLKPYLPKTPKSNVKQARGRRRPVRDFARTQVHNLMYNILHTFFSLYMRVRQTYHVVLDRSLAILYYHHRAPELIKQDIRGLNRIPTHLSVILEVKGDERGVAGLEKLMDDVAEISTWCTCAGIPMLSVYEKSGTEISLRVLRSLVIQNRCFEGLYSDLASNSIS